MSTQLISLVVTKDHAVPVEPYDGSALVTVDQTGGTVFYADNPQVSAAQNQGSIAPGGNHTFTTNVWLISSGLAGVQIQVTSSSGSGGAVSSVFTRAGDVVATTGDYTAAQVTNALDKSNASAQAIAGEIQPKDVAPSGLTGATNATRYVGGTTSAAPASGTFNQGDYVVAKSSGQIFVCTAAGSPGTWVNAGTAGGVATFNTRSGAVVPANADYLAVASGGLTGATAATRYVGGTASGSPASGTFAVGDFVIDQTGMLWICTSAGTPGTWVSFDASGAAAAAVTTHVAAVDPHGDRAYADATKGPARDLQRVLALGFKGWTYDIFGNMFGTAAAPATQLLYGVIGGLLAGDVVTNLCCWVNTPGAGTAPTALIMGIYDLSGNLVATTGNIAASAIWTAGTGPAQAALTAPFTVSTTGAYYFTVFENGVFGTTALQLVQGSVTAVTMDHPLGGASAPMVSQVCGNVTALPNPATFITTQTHNFWMGWN